MSREDLDQYVQSYDPKADYDRDNRLMLQWYPPRVKALCPGDSLLELGLGHGWTTQYFSEHYRKHLVIEGSQKVIDRFQSAFLDVKADIECRYFEEFNTDQQFDVIVMGFVLEHVDDPEELVTHFKPFLKPGGHLVAAVPNAKSLHRLIGHQAGLLPDLYQFNDYDLKVGHKRYYDLESFRSLFTSHGYRIVQEEGLLLKPITSDQMDQLQWGDDIFNALLALGQNHPAISNSILVVAQAL